ncbi:ABC transporter permease [Candidatus Bathyarchaeota archaeon]|nr:MAG: ABC transporter permease [Candidatus Bathyarchaeota archaeon]
MDAKSLVSHSLMIAWKDLMELLRNRMMLIMLVLMPLLMMTMAGFMFPSSTSISHVSVALVNKDEGYGNYSSASAALIAALGTMEDITDMMTITNASTLDEVRSMIQEGEVEGGLVIASNFTSNLMTGKQGTITIITDQTNPQMSMLLQIALKEVLEQMGTWLAQQNIQELPAVNASNSLAMVKPYNVQTEGAVTGDFSYFDFIAPGLMAMTVMMSVMTGLPAAISHEREVGTLDGMMVAPVSRFAVIFGKTLAQTARGMLQGTIILALAVALFGVTIHGSILLIFVLLLVGVFSFVGLGVVITSFAKDQETAMMVMMALMFPMMLLSGVFFPTQQMPWYMQNISKALPLTYAATALRKVMVLGADVSMIATELAVLIGFGVVMITIAVSVFKRAMTR